MERFVNSDEMWTSQENLHVRSDNYWGTLRVLFDKTKKFYYYDILIGRKDKPEIHTHMGFDLIGNLFFNKTRGKVAEINRDIESQLHGKQPSEKMVFNEPAPKAPHVRIQFIPKGKEKESKVTYFEIIES